MTGTVATSDESAIPMDPTQLQAQADSVRAIGELADAQMTSDGPKDWARCSIVLKVNEASDDEVSGWIGLAWDAASKPQGLEIALEDREILNGFRTASTADAEQPRWMSCLLQFDRSGRSRVQYDFESATTWWRDGSEKMMAYVDRLAPSFPDRS